MKATKWCKPLSRAGIHIVENKNMKLDSDNGIWVGISHPRAQDEGGFFVKVAEPGTLTPAGIEKFAEELDTMMCGWLEANRDKLAKTAKSCAKKK